jgi:outer membrane receptor protein involved in Fe transport
MTDQLLPVLRRSNRLRETGRTARAFGPFSRRTTGIAGLLVLACRAGIATPQDAAPALGDLSLEELVQVQLVSTPSKRPQSAREAPAVVTVVAADEIRRHGYRTLGDVLRAVPGFYVTYDHNYSYVGVRGFGIPGDYNTRVLLLLDGVRTNDNIYDAAYVAQEFILDLALVERVEVSRGPGASIYGNSAFFAVVNVVTRTGRSVDGAEAAAAAGGYGTYEARATYGQQLAGGAEVLASLSAVDGRGRSLFFPEFLDQGGFSPSDADGERSSRALASVRAGGFGLQATLVDRRKQVPTASFSTIFGDTRTRTRDVLGLVTATHAATFSEHADLQTRATFGAYEFNGDYAFDLGDGVTDVWRDEVSGRWWEVEANVRVHRGRHVLLAGSEIHGDARQRQDSGYLGTTEGGAALASKDFRLGVYAQDEVSLGPRLRASLGLRLDRSRDLSARVNPRLALVATPDAATVVKLLFGRAYRAANEYEERYYPATRALRPETIRTVELAVERALGRRVRATASVYDNDIRDLISLDTTPEGDLFFRNADRLQGRGAEAGVAAVLEGGLDAFLGYSFHHARDGSGGEPANAPRHLWNGRLSVPLRDRTVWLSGDARYVSQRRDLRGEPVDGHWVADLTLFAPRLPRGLQVSLGLQNVFGADYADPASDEHLQRTLPQAGRTARLQVTWHLR